MILLITAKIAICSAMSFREPITFALDEEIPALYQINKLRQRVDKSLHSNTLPLSRAKQYSILHITDVCLSMQQQMRIMCLSSTILTMIPPMWLCALIDIVGFDVESSILIYIQISFIEL